MKQKIDFILEEDDYPGEETRLLFRFIRGNHAVMVNIQNHQSLGMKFMKWIMYGLSLVSIKMKMKDQIG